MQITLDLNTATVSHIRGLVSLLASVCPEAFNFPETAGEGLSPAKVFQAEPTAERVFAAAPAPDGLAPDGAALPPASGASAGVAEVAPVSDASPPAGGSAPVAAALVRGDLDADGIPWDARIHSEGHAKTKDGKWRLKRGVSEDARASVVAELKAAMGAPAIPPAPPAPASGAEPVAVAPPPPTPAAPVPDAAPAPSLAPPPPPVADAAPPPPPATEATPAPVSGAAAFGALMRKVSPAQAEGKITAAQTTELVVSLGLANLRDLVARPDLIPEFEALFDGFVSAA